MELVAANDDFVLATSDGFVANLKRSEKDRRYKRLGVGGPQL